MTTIGTRLQAVRRRIDAAARSVGRSPEGIRLIAVSKTFAAGAIVQAYAAGQTIFGESYLQEALAKMQGLSGLSAPEGPLLRPLEWHAAADGAQRESRGGERPSAEVASPQAGPLLHSLEWHAPDAEQDDRESRSGERPSAEVPSPQAGPLLHSLEGHATDAGQDDRGSRGGERPSAEVASLQAGPLLRSLEWHFIGPIQSNKTRQIAEHFHWVHGVDRLKIAERLSMARPPGLPPLELCLQVNISGEASKNGVRPDEVLALAQAVARLTGIRLRGLMAIPEPTTDPSLQRSRFRQIRELKDEIVRSGVVMDTLSMGMSDDLEAAIAEGATLVRVGRAIFGERLP